MPIEVNSEKWKSGRLLDPLQIHITEFLRQNPRQAFTVEEITDAIIDEEANSLLLLEGVDDEEALDEVDAETYRMIKTRIAMKLEVLGWRDYVDWKVVDDGDGVGTAYFTTSDKEPISPVSKIKDFYPRRFESIEDDIENLQEEVQRLRR
jgi:hypothetical protein